MSESTLNFFFNFNAHYVLCVFSEYYSLLVAFNVLNANKNTKLRIAVTFELQ